MNREMLLKAFRALEGTARSIATQQPDPHDSTKGSMSPDGIRTYNHLARIFNQKFPDMQLTVFREDTTAINVYHPQTLEILGQIKLAIELFDRGSSQTDRLKPSTRAKAVIRGVLKGIPWIGPALDALIFETGHQ